MDGRWKYSLGLFGCRWWRKHCRDGAGNRFLWVLYFRMLIHHELVQETQGEAFGVVRAVLSYWNNIEILSVDLKTCWVCSLKYLRSWGVEHEEVATKSLWKLWYQPRSLFWRLSFLLTACWRAGINFKNQLKLDQEPSVLRYYPESQGAAFTSVILCDQSPFLFKSFVAKICTKTSISHLLQRTGSILWP